MRRNDLLECPLLNSPRQAGEGREGARFEIDPAVTALPASARPEPTLAAAAFLVEFDEPERLNPDRAVASPERPPPAPRRQTLSFGLAGSLGVHLLPLLVMLHWGSTPAEIAVPIPVQLVLEETPPAPEAKQAKPPPSGRLASVDIGEPAAEPDQPTAAGPPPPAKPAQTQIAAAMSLPKPVPPPEMEPAPPKPAPAEKPAATPPEPKPTPLVLPPVKHAAAARLMPNPHRAPRATGVPGPAATRNEYLAYCMTLLHRYYGMVPQSVLAGRHGKMRLDILVLGDGTIARIGVQQSSGYLDLDSRVEQMVAAVRRFPPLPQWIQRPSIMLTYDLVFPEGLLER